MKPKEDRVPVERPVEKVKTIDPHSLSTLFTDGRYGAFPKYILSPSYIAQVGLGGVAFVVTLCAAYDHARANHPDGVVNGTFALSDEQIQRIWGTKTTDPIRRARKAVMRAEPPFLASVQMGRTCYPTVYTIRRTTPADRFSFAKMETAMPPRREPRLPVTKVGERQTDWLGNALAYLGRGFSFIPVVDKKPVVKTWAEYQDTRQPAESEIIKWHNAQPNAGIGIITGKLSNLVVVDIDGDYHAGLRLLAEHGVEIPETTSVRTAHGVHLWFSHPGVPVKTVAKILKGDGVAIDVRGDGGYVVGPPSVHSTGVRYHFEHEVDPLPLFPAKLLALLRATTEVESEQEAA